MAQRITRYKPQDSKNILGKKIYTNFGKHATDNVEMHIYGGETLLDSEYQEKYLVQYYDNVSTPHISLDLHRGIRAFGYTKGDYNVKFNFFRNILGEEGVEQLFISEISPSRKEVRVKSLDTNASFLSDIKEFAQKKTEGGGKKGSYESRISTDNEPRLSHCLDDLLLNFGSDKQALVINWIWDGEEGDGIIFKLYEALPKDILPKDNLWVVKEMIDSIGQNIKLIPIEEMASGTKTLLPNFELNTPLKVGESGWQSWNDILGSNKNNKQSLMNKFISQSATQTENNVDYRHYKNFVHFSSAVERLENFKYKMRLLEQYSSSLAVLNAMPTPTTFGNTNIAEYEDKVEAVKNGFDGYERFLYYESSSYVSESVGEFYPKTWPKTDTSKPYTNATVDSTEATAWFASQSNVALDWDTVKNEHNLENTIPFHIREDEANSNYLLFTNMVGQHYDEVWGYLSQSLQIHKRDNPLYEGLSKDLVYNVLASLGWESYQGFHFQDLWEYALGLDSDGAYGVASSSFGLGASSAFIPGPSGAISGSIKNTYASLQQMSGSMTREEMSRETWKRMLNNLPYLLKTKGSERGIKALVATYGLPPTLLRVFEYGGPQKLKSEDSYVKYDKFTYSLEFTGSQHVEAQWQKAPASPMDGAVNRVPDAVEVRFNTWTPASYSIITWPKMHVGIEPHPSSSNKASGYYNFGRVTANFFNDGVAGDSIATMSTYFPFYDNDWWNIQVSRTTASYNSGQQHFHVAIAKAADHANNRITHTGSMFVSASEDGANQWNKGQRILFGGVHDPSHPEAAYSNFSGSMQEVRFWHFPYADQVALDYWNDLKPFHNHTRDALQIQSYGATGSYGQLTARYSLGADLNRFSQSDASGWGVQANSGKAIISSSAPSAPRLSNPYAGFYGVATDLTTNMTASGFEMDIENDWPHEEERFYTAMPDLVGTREYTDKTRIESSVLTGRLDSRRKNERSQFDSAPLDSNRLGVYFAPHFEIDLDIAREIAGAKFSNYVGNPLDYRDDEYKRLRILRHHYWYKHINPYSFHDYIKILRHLDYTLFSQIEHILPARANAQVGLLVKPNLLERPKVKALDSSKDELHYEGEIDTSFYDITATTTLLGGPRHQWKNPENGVWSTGSDQAGTQAINAHTGIWPSGSKYGSTDQSEGELVVVIDSRITPGGHDLDNGSRYIWRYMHQWKSNHTSGQGTNNHTSGSGFFNTYAFIQQGGASYENAYEFFTDHGDQSTPASQQNGWNVLHLMDSQSAQATISPHSSFKHRYDYALNLVPRTAASPMAMPSFQYAVQRDNFADFGNIKNYHNQRLSRIYKKEKFYYFSPKNNMNNSGSTGGNPTSAVSMSGWSPAELANGWYRSGLRPVSRSYEAAEVNDYKPAGFRKLFYEGCKLVGSDFNMPVLETVDGGPVVEVTDTNPNAIIISDRNSRDGDLRATGQTMQRSV